MLRLSTLSMHISPLFPHFQNPSPQSHQNLVNYHPIFCPNIGEYSIFCSILEQCVFSGMGATSSGWPHRAGSSKNSEYTRGFHGCRCNKRSVMTLFSGPTDIYSHQVRIVLAEKGVSFEIEHVEKDNPPQDLIDLTRPKCTNAGGSRADPVGIPYHYGIRMSVSRIHR